MLLTAALAAPFGQINAAQVRHSVGFDINKDPYISHPYPSNIAIDYSRDCFIIPAGKRDYQLASLTPREALHTPAAIKTHNHPCGACSSLQDLTVYRKHPNLKSPVRWCGVKHILFGTDLRACIKALGFTEGCAAIWAYNVHNTARTEEKGGCFWTCVRSAWLPSIIPFGTHNPCQPPNATESSKRQANVCSDAVVSKDAGVCLNSINRQPACYRQAWEPGKYRLNAALQCDECRSGPLFKKIAGRTRCNSGLPSAIPRPQGGAESVFRLP